jgi:hypothetical protein
MEFQATSQYDDWKGTASADDSNPGGLRSLLRDRHLISDDEFAVGMEVWIGENHAGQVAPAYVRVLAIRAADFEQAQSKLAAGPVVVRKIDHELSLEEFIGLFKRVSIKLAWRGLPLSGLYDVLA